MDPDIVTESDLPGDGIYVSGIDVDEERADWDHHLTLLAEIREGAV